MTLLSSFITPESIAHAVLVFSLVASLGLLLGSLELRGLSLGIAGVLFVGLLFGHFQIVVNEKVLEFAREFGLILFVYTVGMQVGPGFFSSFRHQGIRLNLLAAIIVLAGAVIAWSAGHWGGIDMRVAVGLFSGATTNTPSLGAAQQALKDLPLFTEEAAKLPGLGYAIAYPFGILGIILAMLLIRAFFRVSIADEAKQLGLSDNAGGALLSRINLEVQNQNLEGVEIQNLSALTALGVVISRLYHEGHIQVAQPSMKLSLGDVVLAVGSPEKLEQLRLLIGAESKMDLSQIPSAITMRRILVTHREVFGKTLAELALEARFAIRITRVSRAGVEFTAHPDLILQFGDGLMVVGEEEAIQKTAQVLGNSVKRMNHPEMIPVFIGIALGIVVGSWPIALPGLPAPVKLGLAGGPLLVAILLSRIGRIGPIVWYMPISANFALRETGIVLFLASVGLKAGDQFLNLLTNGDGFYWMGWGALITIVPLLVVGVIARGIYKINFISICGLLSGSMTDPPALAFAAGFTRSEGAAVSYASVYPLVMLMRVVVAQLFVLLFVS